MALHLKSLSWRDSIHEFVRVDCAFFPHPLNNVGREESRLIIYQGSTLQVKLGGAAQCGGGGVLTYIPNITRAQSIVVKIV